MLHLACIVNSGNEKSHLIYVLQHPWDFVVFHLLD